MTMLNFRRAAARNATLALALGLGGVMAVPAWAAGSAASPAPAQQATQAKTSQPKVVEEDVTIFDMVPGTVYLNGGVGKDEETRMHKDAHNWALRMTFSDKSSNEFVAGVKLKVFNHEGRAVLRMKDAGPMTYVQLPQGEYRITATYKNDMLTRVVHVGPKGLDANFHWAI
ncbi:MAG: hypothetical protein JSS01_16185 [Proteobacteria bacterium]|nr:hypothetical protein [Pseudomonadota bacterium]